MESAIERSVLRLLVWIIMGLISASAVLAQDETVPIDSTDPWSELGLEDQREKRLDLGNDEVEDDILGDRTNDEKYKEIPFDDPDQIKTELVRDIESGSENTINKRTAIYQIYILKMKNRATKAAGKFWAKREKMFRRSISRVIQEQSQFPTAMIEKPNAVPTASRDGFPGIVRMSVDNKLIRVELVSTDRMSVLSKWVFPQPYKMNRKAFDLLARQIGNAIIASFPYQGYVIAKRDRMVKINRGSNHGIKEGMVLKVFELDSTSPTFSSPRYTVGEMEVRQVDEKTSFGKLLSSNADVPLYSKIGFKAQSYSSGKLDGRVTDSAFIGAGWLLKSIEVNPTILDETTRHFQVKSGFSPFMTIMGGYSRFKIVSSSNTVSNGFEQVSFQLTDLSVEILRWTRRRSARMLIGGYITEDYISNPIVIDDDTLYSITKSAPYLGFHYHLVPGEGTKLSADVNGFFPVNLSTQEGTAQGFAFSFNLGLTVGVNKYMSVKGEFGGRSGSYSFVNGRGLPETMWTVGMYLQGHL